MKKLICCQITKQQLFPRIWQTHIVNWNSICHCMSQTPQLLTILLRVLRVNECFQCMALSVTVEYSVRHLRNSCFSSTICKRREIIDSTCDVFANNSELWTVTFLITGMWHCLYDWLGVFITCVEFLQWIKLLAVITLTVPNPKLRNPH